MGSILPEISSLIHKRSFLYGWALSSFVKLPSGRGKVKPPLFTEFYLTLKELFNEGLMDPRGLLFPPAHLLLDQGCSPAG